MYPGQKKSAMTWATQIFLGLSVFILIAAIVVGILYARDGGKGFRNIAADTPFALDR